MSRSSLSLSTAGRDLLGKGARGRRWQRGGHFSCFLVVDHSSAPRHSSATQAGVVTVAMTQQVDV